MRSSGWWIAAGARREYQMTPDWRKLTGERIVFVSAAFERLVCVYLWR